MPWLAHAGTPWLNVTCDGSNRVVAVELFDVDLDAAPGLPATISECCIQCMHALNAKPTERVAHARPAARPHACAARGRTHPPGVCLRRVRNGNVGQDAQSGATAHKRLPAADYAQARWTR